MQRADEITGGDENEEVVLNFYRHLMTKNLEAFADLWSDDAVQEVPFPPEIEGFDPIWSGKEKILSYYNRAIPSRRDHVFLVHEIHRTADPDCIIVEASAHSIIVETGRPYDQRYIFLFKLKHGKIVLNREYINPLAFMKAFG